VDNAATGVALIVVAASGENQIVVAPGANRRLAPETLQLPAGDALIGELEVQLDTVARAVADFEGFTCVNLALPAKEVDDAVLRGADLIVVNEVGGGLVRRASRVARGLGGDDVRCVRSRSGPRG
jgi:ribokinase